MAARFPRCRIARGVLGGMAAALLAGCASAPVRKPGPGIFFPPAPELPRIQYLTSLSGRKDIEEQSSFSKFVAGEEPDVKVNKPYGVAAHGAKIYVCDTNSAVAVFDLKNKAFGTLKGAVGPGALRQPVNISIDAQGRKYVADPVRGQVVMFDAMDEYVRSYGIAAKWRPVDAVPYEGRLYVADPPSSAVRVFDLESGEMVKSIGETGDERLVLPTNVAFDSDGYLYVTDAARFQVVKFDRDGHFKMAIGKLGDNLGHFARPKGTALDREGHLYAVDAAFNKVQIFNPDGRLMLFFGGDNADEPGALVLPAKVALDYDDLSYFQQYVSPGFRVEYLILVTSQFGPRRVNVLAYGRQEGQKYPTDEELMKRIEERRQQELLKMTPKAEDEAAPE